MYPIRNINYCNINSIEDEERRFIIDQAGLLLPDDMSNESKNFIINILIEIPQEERKLLIEHALELIDNDATDEDRQELISILAKIPQQERRAIIDEARCLINEDVSSEDVYSINDYKSMIFKILASISEEERKSVIEDAHRLFIDEIPNRYKIPTINTLSNFSAEERKTIIDQVLFVFMGDKSAQSINMVFTWLFDMTAGDRSLLITQALRLFTDAMSGEDRERLIGSLRQVSIDRLEFLITQAFRLISDSTSSIEDINLLILRLKSVPLDEMESLITQGLRLITDTMNIKDKVRIINILSQVPTDEIEFLITQALRLVTDRMSSHNIINLIDCLSAIPLENMEFLLTQALRLITNDMTWEDREYIIACLLSMSENQREFLIMQVLHLSTEVNTAEDRMEIINVIYERLDEYRFVTSSSEIMKNPIKLIVDLYEILEKKYIGLLPSFIQYTNSQGIDDGGLTRSFVATLTESFCNAKYGFVINNEMGVIPILQENESLVISLKDQEKCFNVIGRFFSSAAQEYKSIVLGQHFHPMVFEMIFNLTAEDLANYGSSEVFDKMLRICILKELNSSEEFAETLVQGTITDELREIYCIDSKEECIEEYQFDKKIKAILIIAKSIYDSLLNKAEWDTLKGNSVDSLREKIEGVISRDRVRSALKPDEMDEPDEISLEYIKKWITGTNSEMLEKLIEAISGMKTLNSTTKLHIAGVNGLDKLPEFHTCFFRMDLSQYSSYEAFKEKLEISLRYCFSGSGFQMA